MISYYIELLRDGEEIGPVRIKEEHFGHAEKELTRITEKYNLNWTHARMLYGTKSRKEIYDIATRPAAPTRMQLIEDIEETK